MQNPHQFHRQSSNGESLGLDVFIFLVKHWLVICGSGFLGVLGAVIFILLTPNLYSGTAQIKIMQVFVNDAKNLMGNIEDPNLLASRYKVPSSLSKEIIKACGEPNSKFPAESLVNIIKLTPIRGINSVVELKVSLESKGKIFNCLQTIFEDIREYQANAASYHLDTLESELKKYQQNFKDIKVLVDRADNSGFALSAAYLVYREEANFLRDKIYQLKVEKENSNFHQAKLISPIYISEAPIFPIKKLCLLIGFFIGILSGFLFIGIFSVWNSYKSIKI
jgi:uncharacterized protein involved in exopolysaccharide biosynthesis